MTNEVQAYLDCAGVYSQAVYLLLTEADVGFNHIQDTLFGPYYLERKYAQTPPPILVDSKNQTHIGAKSCIEFVTSLSFFKDKKVPPSLSGRATKWLGDAISLEASILFLEVEYLWMRLAKDQKATLIDNAKQFTDTRVAALYYNIKQKRILVADLKQHMQRVHKLCLELNHHLGFQLMLSSDEMGATDLVWLPIIKRLEYIGWPIYKYLELNRWRLEMETRVPYLLTFEKQVKLPPKYGSFIFRLTKMLTVNDIRHDLYMLLGISEKNDADFYLEDFNIEQI